VKSAIGGEIPLVSLWAWITAPINCGSSFVICEMLLNKLKTQLKSVTELDEIRALTKEIQEVLQAIEAEQRIYKR